MTMICCDSSSFSLASCNLKENLTLHVSLKSSSKLWKYKWEYLGLLHLVVFTSPLIPAKLGQGLCSGRRVCLLRAGYPPSGLWPVNSQWVWGFSLPLFLLLEWRWDLGFPGKTFSRKWVVSAQALLGNRIHSWEVGIVEKGEKSLESLGPEGALACKWTAAFGQ